MRKEYNFNRGKRGAVIRTPPGKTRITIRLDDDVLEAFRAQVHESRDQDRHADYDRELVEQPPHDAGHEQDRNEYGRQRQGHRDDGETDLLG
jgi:hypothetical protein